MTMDLREEVARALCRLARRDPDWDRNQYDDYGGSWTDVAFPKGQDRAWNAYEKEADAAISVIQSRAKGQPGVDGLADAMQAAWDDYTSDTGCFPDAFKITRGPKLWAQFRGSEFARLVHMYLATPSNPGGWRPISSAPKDGTPILAIGYAPKWKYPIVIEWDEKRADWKHTDPSLDSLYGVSDSVAFWQPLPPPPIPVTEGEGS